MIFFNRNRKPNDEIAKDWETRGLEHDKLDQYKKALKCFDKALKFNPRLASAWVNRGTDLNNLGMYKDALISFDKAHEIDKNYYNSWNNRGVALDNLGRYKEAVDSYDEAIKLKHDYSLAWWNRGILFKNQGNFEEAAVSLITTFKLESFRYDFERYDKRNQIMRFLLDSCINQLKNNNKTNDVNLIQKIQQMKVHYTKKWEEYRQREYDFKNIFPIKHPIVTKIMVMGLVDNIAIGIGSQVEGYDGYDYPVRDISTEYLIHSKYLQSISQLLEIFLPLADDDDSRERIAMIQKLIRD